MARMALSDLALSILDNAGVLKQPYLPSIIGGSQQFHALLTVCSLASIDSIHISTIHELFEKALYWPAKSQTPSCPLLIPCAGRSSSDLLARVHIPKE